MKYTVVSFVCVLNFLLSYGFAQQNVPFMYSQHPFHQIEQQQQQRTVEKNTQPQRQSSMTETQIAMAQKLEQQLMKQLFSEIFALSSRNTRDEVSVDQLSKIFGDFDALLKGLTSTDEDEYVDSTVDAVNKSFDKMENVSISKSQSSHVEEETADVNVPKKVDDNKQKLLLDLEKNPSNSEKIGDEESLIENVRQSSKFRRENSHDKQLKIKKSAKSWCDK